MYPACWAVFLMVLGCDLPDRHDIAMFRQPAPWEVERDQAPVEIAAEEALQVGPADAMDRWQWWRLELMKADSRVIGGTWASASRDDEGQLVLKSRHQSLMPFAPPSDADSASPFRYLVGSEQTYWQDQDGRLLKMECRIRRGPLEFTNRAEVGDTEVRFTSDLLTSTKTNRVSHSGPLGGPLTMYQSLMLKPLAKGEERIATVVLPISNELAELKLDYVGPSIATTFLPELEPTAVPVPVGNGSQGRTSAGSHLDRLVPKNQTEPRSLTEAIAVLRPSSGNPSEQTYWYDDRGVVESALTTMQTSLTNLQQRATYRCTETLFNYYAQPILQHAYPLSMVVPGKSIAQALNKPGATKLMLTQLGIEISPRAELPKRTDPSSPTGVDLRIGTAPRQYIQTLQDGKRRVLLSAKPVAKNKLAGRFHEFDSPPTPRDLQLTPIIDSKASAVQRLIRVSAVSSDVSVRDVARELNRTVHSLLSFQPLSTGIRSASSIASSTLADSTEHAILLIAMLRDRKIPSRLEVGLKYQQDDSESGSTLPANRFVYHAWVIAWVDETWVALNPVSGLPTGADCLAIDQHDLVDFDASGFFNRYRAILDRERWRVFAVVTKPSK